MRVVPLDHPLRQMFAGLTEHAFFTVAGVADTALIDYLAELLVRFVDADELTPLEDVVDVTIDCFAERSILCERHQQIGDTTLFWSGLYPEARSQRHGNAYWTLLGRESYRMASELAERDSTILRRLSDEFELCAHGLRAVRKEWEEQTPLTKLWR